MGNVAPCLKKSGRVKLESVREEQEAGLILLGNGA
jgi:hypothetical protein